MLKRNFKAKSIETNRHNIFGNYFWDWETPILLLTVQIIDPDVLEHRDAALAAQGEGDVHVLDVEGPGVVHNACADTSQGGRAYVLQVLQTSNGGV